MKAIIINDEIINLEHFVVISKTDNEFGNNEFGIVFYTVDKFGEIKFAL